MKTTTFRSQVSHIAHIYTTALLKVYIYFAKKEQVAYNVHNLLVKLPSDFSQHKCPRDFVGSVNLTHMGCLKAIDVVQSTGMKNITTGIADMV